MLRLTLVVLVCTLTVLDLVQATPCSSGADCASDECCIDPNHPRGKRALYHATGHCAPLGTSGSGCLMMYPYSGPVPSTMVYECPCQTGLSCHGIGTFDVPLGEMGRCS